MKTTILCALWVAGTALAVEAQQFDGLYHPNLGENRRWQCTVDYVGSDGGALQIQRNQLWDVETRCNLHDERELGDTGIYQYFASCFVDGSVYRTDMFIALYDEGVLVADGNGINDWRSCDFQTQEQDISLTLGTDRFLGVQLDLEAITGFDLVPIYWYVHSVCRGVIPSWPAQTGDNACLLRSAIWQSLEAKGWSFDRNEQDWVQ